MNLGYSFQTLDSPQLAETTISFCPDAASSEISAGGAGSSSSSRYENQKRRDWNTFGQYLRNHRPPLSLPRCSGAHVLEFLRYLDQFGKTKVHTPQCPFYGYPNPPDSMPLPPETGMGEPGRAHREVKGRLRGERREP
ncbi:hypothetical protein MLD38_040798 [Melastoma candidum]|nr:hypothetical protein MLD38_040798 [Melastoma candidum]